MGWFANSIAMWAALIPFAAFFCALALLAKGRGRAIADARGAVGEWRTNLLIFLFDMLLVLPYVALPAAWIIAWVGPSAGLAHVWTAIPAAVTGLAAVVLGDYVGYWRHRVEHCPLLWRFHATHHSDRAMSWFSLNRMHPVNRLTTTTIDSAALALAGFPLWAVALNGIVRNAWGYFIHADLRWTLGPLGALLISPSAHRWHHVRDEAMAGTNFATIFTLWDRLHGTFQPSREPCREPTGVEGHSGGFLYEMLEPFGLWPRQRAAKGSAAVQQLMEA
ncbi:sterol desaturase family protein [Sphingopyxis sp. DBS4]|uniref:sterol desaturase family protein n=1 Tax=Sphingopyxis sp. DBS4 TaxID=2968500 RepID=UPI00214BED5A|nr:sterol desaturase family protein [Sphingopyxis sp. DBS4]